MTLVDEEESCTHLLGPTPEYLASVKVFPLIPNLKKDVMVSSCLEKRLFINQFRE